MRRRLAILGSTGSIGSQTLDIVRQNTDLFEVSVLVANNSWELLVKQAKEFNPKVVVISNTEYYHKVKEGLHNYNIEVLASEVAISDVVCIDGIDIVVTAMVGFSGLVPTIKAIESGKKIALANKETLVVAGELIMPLVKKYNSEILPVDSEHSAIYQCLVGDNRNVEKLILTASGGPFRNLTKEELKYVTKEQALKHPNWTMGAKVTIDSASLMNKGLEVIEAHWLFNIPHNYIEVVVHPQSIIHSMVCYQDGSYKAQLGIADMRIPISYAIGLKNRVSNNLNRLDFADIGELTFQKPDLEKFPNLAIAYQVVKEGGSASTVMNAANEVAVENFLADKISFCDISHIISKVVNEYNHHSVNSIDEYINVDKKARLLALDTIQKIK